MEVFQHAYGMETEWEKEDKTTFFVLGPTAPPPQKKKKGDRDALQVTLHLPDGTRRTLNETEDRVFLRTPINDTTAQRHLVLGVLQSFSFPRPGRDLPLTALRKIAHTILGSRIRSRLQLHSIRSSTTVSIHSAINVMIQKYYREPFAASPDLLRLPLSKGGFDFPDFDKMNAIWSISTLHRAINTSNVTMRKAYQIMYATFQCFGKLSHRCYLPFAAPLVTYSENNGPRKNNFIAWEVPRQYLIDLDMKIIPATRLNIGPDKEHNARGDNSAVWKETHNPLSDIESMLQSLVDRVVTAPVEGDFIKWATDGSVDNTKMLDAGRTAFSVVGPISFSARLKHDHSTIQDAEVVAIIVAISLDLKIRRKFNIASKIGSVVYTDHLNTVRRVRPKGLEALRSPQPHEPSRHVIRWLMASLETNKSISLVHQKAHTDGQGEAALMNDAADQAAKAARESTRFMYIPECYGDDFALYSTETGVSHSHVTTLISEVWDTHKEYTDLVRTGNVFRYQPSYLFTTTPSGFSAKTQLLIRSRQLPTQALKTERNFQNIPLNCVRCTVPSALSDQHHVFVNCVGAREILLESVEKARLKIKAYNENGKFATSEAYESHAALSTEYFQDGDCWADGTTRYYYGELPKHFKYDDGYSDLYREICGLGILTASRLWGTHLRALSTNKTR
ncbi:hypothetical protein IAR55_006294 [Kwoniella newhampshirensis]|uniref:RNase H type-1 domain-containing protein n=1 Tax=Kwoniella newhampshirensis TaxID=1651941 RepID=A0AAW0YSE2_9TREE